MSARHFVIELGAGPASGRRTLEALELAAGLAAFDHRVTLVLHPAALARLATARGDPELAERLELVAETGIGPALTGAAGAPGHVGPLAVEIGDVATLRGDAEAVLVF